MKLESIEKYHFYHIYNRGINGTNIFNSNKNKDFFLQLYKKYLLGMVSTFAYCLLQNHYHFVVRIEKEPKEVVQAFSNFFNAYAKAFNKEQNRTGSLFEKHFKRIRLQDENYLKKLIIYVHLNPSLHFNYNFKNYTYSSYSNILSAESSWLQKEEIFQLFGGKENFSQTHIERNMSFPENYKLE